MKRLAIFGAGGHGRVIGDIAMSSGWDSIDFYDDFVPAGKSLTGLSISGNLTSLIDRSTFYSGFHIAIGDNEVRLDLLRKLLSMGLRCPNIIAPSAVIASTVRFGVGISIMANVVVNSRTIVTDGVILNTGCTVDHDCRIQVGAHISPGAHLAGNVSVGERSWVGIGSAIIEGRVIGSDAVIGAGSVVIQDVSDTVTVAGNPSRVIEC